MKVVYTVLIAIVCAALLVGMDLLLQKAGKKHSILQKQIVRMPIAYLTGILLFLIMLRALSRLTIVNRRF